MISNEYFIWDWFITVLSMAEEATWTAPKIRNGHSSTPRASPFFVKSTPTGTYRGPSTELASNGTKVSFASTKLVRQCTTKSCKFVHGSAPPTFGKLFTTAQRQVQVLSIFLFTKLRRLIPGLSKRLPASWVIFTTPVQTLPSTTLLNIQYLISIKFSIL